MDLNRYAIIKLNDGYETIIDIDDFDRVNKYKWRVDKNGYVFTFNMNNKIMKLSNFIMNHTPTSELTVDHINRERRDNRKKNLRIVNKSIQSINQNISKKNTSGTKGIYYSKCSKCWVAECYENGKKKQKVFYVKKYGYDNAKELAKNYRRYMERTIEIYKEALCISDDLPIDYSIADVEKCQKLNQIIRLKESMDSYKESTANWKLGGSIRSYRISNYTVHRHEIKNK